MKKKIVFVVAGFVLAAALPGTGAGAAPAPSTASSRGEDASINKADNAIIARGDMSLEIPPRGATAIMELAREDGTFSVLTVEHRRDGEVRTTYRPGGDNAGPEPVDESYDSALAAGTTLPACSDSAYITFPSRVASQPYFLVNDDVLSDTVTSAAMMKQAMLNGGNNIVNARNDCGMADNVDAPALSGVGDTSLRTQFYVANGDHYCTDYDVWSVVELGTLYGAFASACIMTWDNGDVMSADIRFNRDKNWFMGAAPSCATKTYHDLEGTATHELGHVYGLNHAVADGSPLSEHTLHADLTMHGYAPLALRKCSTRYRTLGKGDILGLESKY